jgi:type I restriction enzyme S subunit
MLGLGCLTQAGFQPIQLKNAPRGDPLLSKVVLRDGDLLVSRANTRELVGLVGIYRDVGRPCTYPDLMMRLTLRGVPVELMELAISSLPVRRQLQAAASGTSGSMVKISGGVLRAVRIALPKGDERERIIDATAKIRQRIAAENHAVTKMKAIKHGLMEDVLTGRVRVTRLLEAAAE